MRLASARCAALGLLLASACSALRSPIVQSQVVETSPGLLRKVAVAPFQPDPSLRPGSGPTAVSAALAAELVTRFVTEALGARGIAVVAPNDLVLAFEAQGAVLPRSDAVTLAALAASQFGASSVLLGRVQRYREREGGPSGALRAASVAFDIELYAAPSGEKVYMAHFDHTQPALSASLFDALRYPGGGTRWLSAAELTRWGADHAIREIPGGMQ